MAQDRKRNYRNKSADNVALASSEMGNVPPQAIDIEEAVLGAMMVNTDSVDHAMDLLTSPAFYDLKNRSIFEAIRELYNERSPIDMLTVVEKMRQMGTLDEVGGPVRIATLTQKVGAAANVEYYVRILQQKVNHPEGNKKAFYTALTKEMFESIDTLCEKLSAAVSKQA